MAFGGFPRRVQYTPVPSPVFGPLLEEIDDLGELKCTLRRDLAAPPEERLSKVRDAQ